MPPRRRVRVRVNNLPAAVSEALAADERSVTDACVSILSERYGLPHEPSGQPSRRTEVTDSILLKLPEPVWVKVKREATPYSTLSATIVQALAQHYEIGD